MRRWEKHVTMGGEALFEGYVEGGTLWTDAVIIDGRDYEVVAMASICDSPHAAPVQVFLWPLAAGEQPGKARARWRAGETFWLKPEEGEHNGASDAREAGASQQLGGNRE